METKFNFNSQVCTDRQHSERLLALGLKQETADCYWFYCEIAKEWKCATLSSTQVFKDYPTTVIPAWSLHRLLRMYQHEGDEDVYLRLRLVFSYDDIIDQIEYDIKEGYFPKEYLV